MEVEIFCFEIDGESWYKKRCSTAKQHVYISHEVSKVKL